MYGMAITFMMAKMIGRSSGRSIVSAAAYRHRTQMFDQQTGQTYRYDRQAADLVHEELALPDVTPAWLRSLIDGRDTSGASEAFWNRVEAFEKRADAQLAKELILALPLELSRTQNIALVREFVRYNLQREGIVADWVYHDRPGNPHVHILTTLRPLSDDGFGRKKIPVLGPDGKPLRVEAAAGRLAKIRYRLWAGDEQTMAAWKRNWADTTTRHLALAGHCITLDGRSYEERGLSRLAQKHQGPARTAMLRKAHQPRQVAAPSKDAILPDPAMVLNQIAQQLSVFDDHDIARAVNRVTNDASGFANLHARVLQDPELVNLAAAKSLGNSKSASRALYTTRSMIDIEYQLAERAIRLASRQGFHVGTRQLEKASVMLRAHDKSAGQSPLHLDDEQQASVLHLLRDQAIGALVGHAGAGKSTSLRLARQAWEISGYRVVGAALAGKAAEELEKSAGIAARTLASWELRWAAGREHLTSRDVLVLDEAGMVGSSQMERVLRHVEGAGAKLVLVGDTMQLQPIAAGAAFRTIVERIGYSRLSNIRRQSQDWARQASHQLAKGEVRDALAAYAERGHVHLQTSMQMAIHALVEDWSQAERLAKLQAKDRYDTSQMIVLAHRNADVKALNDAIRQKRQLGQTIASQQVRLETAKGSREFARGDRVVFLQNARFIEPRAAELGVQQVRNGQLGTIRSIAGRSGAPLLQVELDTGASVAFTQASYHHVDHGYAITIHKAQGATFERAFVLASPTMDRHLAYVALTRHRAQADLYVAEESFTRTPERITERDSFSQGVTGTVLASGLATYVHAAKAGRKTPYVDVRTDLDRTVRLWGAALPAALAKAGVGIGDRAQFKRTGVEDVLVPDVSLGGVHGQEQGHYRRAKRNIWQAQRLGTLAESEALKTVSDRLEPVATSLSRDGQKTSTLDYEDDASLQSVIEDFAHRRGLVWVSRQFLKLENAVHHAVAWIGEQRQRLVRLGERLGHARLLGGHGVSPTPDPAGVPTRIQTGIRFQPDSAARLDEQKPVKPPPLLAAVTHFDKDIMQEAADLVRQSEAYRRERRQLLAEAGKVWRDPVRAVRLLEEQLGDEIRVEDVVKMRLQTPQDLGPLRGSDRLVDRWLASGRERQRAQHALSSVQAQVHVLASTLAHALPLEVEAVSARRKRLAVTVPGLSAPTLAALDAVERQNAAGVHNREVKAATLTPQMLRELQDVDQALRARLGPNGVRALVGHWGDHGDPLLRQQVDTLRLLQLVHRTVLQHPTKAPPSRIANLEKRQAKARVVIQ
jgi:Ti-type conjugative transfer relaxase TraA